MKLILLTLIVALSCGFNYGCTDFITHMEETSKNSTTAAAANSWVQAPISQMIESWGPPTSITPKDSGVTDYEWYWWGTKETTKAAGETTRTHVVRCVTKLRVDATGLVMKFIPTHGPNDRCDLRPPLPSQHGRKN